MPGRGPARAHGIISVKESRENCCAKKFLRSPVETHCQETAARISLASPFTPWRSARAMQAGAPSPTVRRDKRAARARGGGRGHGPGPCVEIGGPRRGGEATAGGQQQEGPPVHRCGRLYRKAKPSA